MKRKMLKSNNGYEPVSQTDENNGNIYPDSYNKKKGILCPSSRKRMYVLLILSGLALMWVFVYYKLLNHKFELPEPLRELQRLFGDGEPKRRRGRWDETENFEPKVLLHQRQCVLPQFREERKTEVIHISLVACKDRVKQAIVSLKAITLVTNHFVHFHIFTDNKNYERRTFEKELESWPSFIRERWMIFTTHHIQYPIDDEEERQKWFSLFKPCATQRLFLPSILIDVDAVIYIDTDVLFLRPPEELWKHFEKFSGANVAALSHECESEENCWYKKDAFGKFRHPFFEPHGVNSGIMLMNLTRMRSMNWEQQLIEIYQDHQHSITWGDQDLLNIFFQKHRKLLYTLSCVWNYRPYHCLHGNLCNEAGVNGVSLLHGNHESFLRKTVQPEFYTMYDAYAEFSWEKEGNFQRNVVNVTSNKLSTKYRNTNCGRMRDAFLKYIKC